MKAVITRILLITLCSYIGLVLVLACTSTHGEFREYRFMSCYGGLFILLLLYLIFSIIWSGIFENTWHSLHTTVIFTVFAIIDSVAGWWLMKPRGFCHADYYVSSWEWFFRDWNTRIYPVAVISAFHVFFYFFSFHLVRIDKSSLKTFEIRQNIKLGLRKLNPVPRGFFQYFLTMFGIILYNYMVATAFFVQWGSVLYRE